MLLILGLTAVKLAGAETPDSRGLPFIRSYPLDEIGNVPRGLRLGFDRFGRVAVMYDAIYSVLNDSAWVNLIDASSATKFRLTSIKLVHGRYYYGGRGSWGVVDSAPDGRFRAAPLVPSDAPAWTGITAFNTILATDHGVIFFDFNGAIYWDATLRKNTFFGLDRLSTLFYVGDHLIASCQNQDLREILPDAGTVRTLSGTGVEGSYVKFTAALDGTHTLLALQDGRLMVFDGTTAVPWPPQARYDIVGRISGMEPLVEGGVAIAIAEQGVFLVATDGTLRWSLRLPEFRRVGAMAAGEPGVLWIAGENAVHKIYYDSPLTSFGQQLGLSPIWPTIADWNGRIIVCSNGLLYQMETSAPGEPSRFRPMPTPNNGAECSASQGDLFLVGNTAGVFAPGGDGNYTSVLAMENVSGLEFIAPDTCLAIGSREIAALRYAEGKWMECARRIASVGNGPIRTTVSPGAVWIEMGGDRVLRLLYREGQLTLQPLEMPWKGAQWTNVGLIDRTIVLSGTLGQRAYYDDARETFCAAPELDEILRQAPYLITHITADSTGTLWATHAQGVMTFTPGKNGYSIDSTTFDLRNDSYPAVRFLPGNSIWITGGRSLYHVERQASGTPRPHAVLVSVQSDNQNLELLNQSGHPAVPPEFPFDANSLSFRIFSGTYAWRYPPLYEYRLGRGEKWKQVEPSLLLHFPQLKDGQYRLEVRPAGPDAPSAPPLALEFTIAPPWYRTSLSYTAAALLLLLWVAAIVRWTNHQSLRRNLSLQRLVRDRTRQLEETMEKLAKETGTAAIFAERSRLAGEIHDSLQQGLSGSILQLDTTMNLPGIQLEVRSRLHVMRKMLSYTREELHHAVWNLESPLLQNSNLGDALRELTDLIASGSIEITVEVPESPITLEPAIQHHLLRIAQEAITNAVKHSRAQKVDISLRSAADAGVLTITDNGVGFDLPALANIEGRFGLRGMRERARSINAELTITSAPRRGTTIQVKVPLHDFQSHVARNQI